MLDLVPAVARNAQHSMTIRHPELTKGYADVPQGLADAPWTLPKDGLPADFATLVSEVDALPAAVRIAKRQMSAFFGSEPDLQLRRRGSDTVAICGVATNLGVEATARAAFDLNYDVVIARTPVAASRQGCTSSQSKRSCHASRASAKRRKS